MAYTTSAKVLRWSQFTSADLTVTDSDFATTVTNVIAEASDMIEEYCRVPSGFFDAAGVTVTDEYHDGREVGQGSSWISFYAGRDDPFLPLKYSPVLSVTTLSEETSAGAWTARTEGRGNDFLVLENGVRFLANVPRYEYKNIKVTYVVGYAAVPSGVALCCARLAAALLQKIKDAKKGRKSGSLGALSSSAAPNPSLSHTVFSRALKELVKPYVRRTPVRCK